MNEKCVEVAKARAKASVASAGGSSDQVPKNAHTAKFCQHCKNNGGPYRSHNIKKCCKYDKDGKAVSAATKEPYKKKPYKKHGVRDDKQIAYLMDTIESLVKKGLKKAAKERHKKRSWDDSSSDADSE